MIKSMTGFGRAEIQDHERKFTVEIKSVNHRYLDFNIKMPKKFGFFENTIRGVLKEYMQRGKVDVFITYEDYTQSNVAVQYNREIAAQYLQYFKKWKKNSSLKMTLRYLNLDVFRKYSLWKRLQLMRKSCGAFWNRRFGVPVNSLRKQDNRRERIFEVIFI